MKIREEIRVIEQKVILYVAEDGTGFASKYECEEYERKQNLKKLIEAAEKLRIEELDGYLPLSTDGLMNENNTFIWYKVDTQEDFETLNEAYSNQLNEPIYPEIICVETVGYEAYMDDAYSYDMTTCRDITENFWKKLGYKVTFEKVGD